jgi:hypothetical protein
VETNLGEPKMRNLAFLLVILAGCASSELVRTPQDIKNSGCKLPLSIEECANICTQIGSSLKVFTEGAGARCECFEKK